jgi:hypothetical protein
LWARRPREGVVGGSDFFLTFYIRFSIEKKRTERKGGGIFWLIGNKEKEKM